MVYLFKADCLFFFFFLQLSILNNLRSYLLTQFPNVTSWTFEANETLQRKNRKHFHQS